MVEQAGVVLLNLRRQRVGVVSPSERLAHAQPVVVDGDNVAQAVSRERPVLPDLEERYLSAAEDAWLYSLLMATLLSLPVGSVCGNRFTAPIRELVLATEAMRVTNLRQSVPVRSNDEIGHLSAVFNHMSTDLPTAYQELEESRARLGKQATMLEELSAEAD